jgi:hypothetical protein
MAIVGYLQVVHLWQLAQPSSTVSQLQLSWQKWLPEGGITSHFEGSVNDF